MLLKYINQLNEFNDIYAIMSDLNNVEKGNLFEELTELLFRFHPNYINITKKIWLYKNVPNHLKQQLNIPQKDEGIDLVMLSNDGDFYAIQCKYRQDKNIKIKWDELGTFVGMTFGVGKGFKKGFFVTNTINITKNILNSNKIIPIYGDFFDNIPVDVFNLMKSYLISKNVDIHSNPPIPRDYQKNIIGRSIMHFSGNDRGYLEMACGT